MSKKVCASVFVMMLVLVAGTVAAQTTTSTEIRQGEVLAVYGSHLVVKTDTGETKEFDVPEGFKFDHKGQMIGIEDLEPGMILTAAITTKTTPIVVETEDIKNGTVMHVTGRSAVIRNDDTGETKRYLDIPTDFVFYVNGEPKTVWDLKKGMKVTAHIVSKTSEIVTEKDWDVAASDAPRAAAAAAPAPKPAPAPTTTTTSYASSSTLPKTGSLLPLVGLVGLLALVAGLGLGIIRRF